MYLINYTIAPTEPVKWRPLTVVQENGGFLSMQCSHRLSKQRLYVAFCSIFFPLRPTKSPTTGVARRCGYERYHHRRLHDVLSPQVQHRLPANLHAPHKVHSLDGRDWCCYSYMRHPGADHVSSLASYQYALFLVSPARSFFRTIRN